jgi:hypothetical protein
MIWAVSIRAGDTVRDRKLGQVWTVVGEDGAGGFYIECNGVRASAVASDLERCFPSGPASRPFGM